jgi:hypothetical protein
VNAAYALVFRSTSGVVLSSFGLAIALALLALARVSRRLAEKLECEIVPTRAHVLVVLAVFIVPGLWLLLLRGRQASPAAAVVAAWLATIAWLIFAAALRHGPIGSRAAAGRLRLPLLTTLFVVWSTVFWLGVVWELGAHDLVVHDFHEDRLSLTFDLWRTEPASDHLFLMWGNRAYFPNRVAYTSIQHPYLLSVYAFARLVRALTGLPLESGRNLTPFALAGLGAAVFGLMIARSSFLPKDVGARFYLTLFLGLGFLLSELHFWTYIYTQQLDNIFPIIAYLTALVWASAQPRIGPRNRRLLWASAAALGTFGWMYVPLVIVGLWCLFGRLRPPVSDLVRRNRLLIESSCIAIGVGGAAYLVPRLLVVLKGYKDLSSGFAFRSGLDGDTSYFQSMTQAVLHPFCCGSLRVPIALRPGSVWDLLFPAFVPLAFALAVGVWQRRRQRIRAATALLFLAAPYFWSVALVPQSVSIHPFLYDHLLLLPVALLGATLLLNRDVQQRLRGPIFLAFLLVMTIAIMANLIGVAQGLRKAMQA